MRQYHKIQTVFKRDPETKFKTLLEGDWSEPEFGFLKSNEWIWTEKVDGTNIRVMCQPPLTNEPAYGVTFGGKTDAAMIPAFLVAKLEQRFHSDDARTKLAEMFKDGACLYGEGYGAKIQKGGNYRQDQDFVLFDVKVGEWWLQRKDVEQIALELGLDVVPILRTGTLSEMVEAARAGFQSRWGAFPAEGIVARPAIELQTRSGHRIITKIKHRDFAVR